MTKVFKACLTSLLLCLLLSACHSSRRTTTAAPQQGWHTLEVPVKVVIDKPMDLSLSGRMTLVRDSSVYLSMRMLGMEVAFATANADSVILCDRYHKMYIAEPLRALLPAKYAAIGELQRILTGCSLPTVLRDHIVMTDPVDTPLGQAHQVINTDTRVGNSTIKATLIYQFDKAVWDGQPRKLPAIPRGAERIEASKLLKIIGQQ